MNLKNLLVAASMTFVAAPLVAHEFWIDSKKYQVEIGENIAAFTKNGQNFKGVDLAYFTRRVVLFDRIDADGRMAVVPRLGDSPVFDKASENEGLLTLVYQSTADKLTYKEWAKFDKFAKHKAFGDVLEKHRARGLNEEEFKETYSRFAKGLFAVGSGAGQDTQQGLEVEIVALKNPYTDDVSEGLPVQVFYREMPRINAQVEIFERSADGVTEVSTVQTNAQGIAIVPVKSGYAYLLDNVVLREPSKALAAETGAVWETLWAALTFEVR